jgi:hypothetical protein
MTEHSQTTPELPQRPRHGRIAAAAIRTDDGVVHTLPPPARHNTIMQHFGVMATPDQQGFITDAGQWVRRLPALRIAREAGQIINETAPAHGLFSEDVW